MTVDLSYLDETDPIENIEVAAARNFDPVPDGPYTVEIVGCEVTTSKAGSPMLKWTLCVIGGPFAGRQLWRYNQLASEANRKWTKTDLSRCGFQIAKWSDLPARCGELCGIYLEVQQKTVGQYSNIYFNRVMTRAEIDAMPTSAASVAADKNDLMPF